MKRSRFSEEQIIGILKEAPIWRYPVEGLAAGEHLQWKASSAALTSPRLNG